MAATRITVQTARILRLLAEDPDRERYGLDIAAELKLGMGTVYPVLARLAQVEWVTSRWEEDGAHLGGGGRPRRRYYRLNPSNRDAVQDALRQAAEAGQRRPAGHLAPA